MAKRKDKTASPKTPEDTSQSAATGRSRTRERRIEREREKRRRQQLTLAGAIAVVAVIVIVLVVIANQPAEAPIPENAAARYADVPQSTTEKGYPLLGDPEAPVQVVEYSSFDCSSCARFHDEAFPALVERVKAGDIAFTYVPLFGTGSFQNGEGAARTAICASEQGKFWPMHDALFTWQGTYGNQAFTQNRLVSGVANLGVDRARYDQCIGGSLPQTVLDAARADATALGSDFTGTPTILVNGVSAQATLDSVNAAIDNVLTQLGLGQQVTPEATQEATTEATSEATSAAESETTLEATAESTASAGS